MTDFVLALTLTVMSPSSWAEGQALSGVGLQLEYGMASSHTHDSSVGTSAINQYGDQSSVANVGVTYSHTFDGPFNLGSFISHFNLGTCLDIDLNHAKVGGWTSGLTSYQLQLRELKSVAIEPGILISRTSLAYLKPSYWRGSVQARYQASVAPEAGDSRIHGWGIGVGMRSQINRHITWGVEAEQLQFSEASIGFPIHHQILKEKVEQIRAGVVLGIVF